MFRNLCVLILVAAAYRGGVPLRAEQTAGQSAVLILRNGNVLTGEIERVDDRYVVKLPTGEIRVPAGQVELLCRDLKSAYQLKRTALRSDSAAEHLELARWCLRHELPDCAAEEIRTARRIEPNHPRLAMLEKLLALSRQPDSSANATANRRPPLRRVPTTEELDEMTRTLPEGTLETFTVLVQPVLLNNCATSGCHGARDTNHLRLEQTARSRHASRRPTQRNLHAIIELIRPDDPAHSPLLTYPLRAHGGADKPVFTAENDAQYQRIVEWVQRLADPHANISDVAKIPAGLVPSAPKAGLLRPPPAGKTSPTSAGGQAKESSPPPIEVPRQLQQPSSVLPASYEQQTSEHTTQPASTPGSGRPAATDPFDPDVFNRQRADGPSTP